MREMAWKKVGFCLFIVLACCAIAAGETSFCLSVGGPIGRAQTDAFDAAFLREHFTVSSESGFASKPSWSAMANHTFGRKQWGVTGLVGETRFGQSTVEKTFSPGEYLIPLPETVHFPFRYSIGTMAALLSYQTDERALPFVQLQAGIGGALYTRKASVEPVSDMPYRSQNLKSDSHFGLIALGAVSAPSRSRIYGIVAFEYRRAGQAHFDMESRLPDRADGRSTVDLTADFTHWQVSAGIGFRLP